MAMSSFVTRAGHQLMLDGQAFYANGWNSYWLMVTASDSNTRPRVDEVLRDGAALGLTVCRTWAFNDDTYQALQMAPGVYDEKVFQVKYLKVQVAEVIKFWIGELGKALDYVIYQAQRNGVRVFLSLVNNWKDYGGKAKYVAWAKAAGESVASDDDFFRNSKCRQYYKDHVKAVLTRVNTITKVEYRKDPSIFGWELMNEPQCPSDSSGNTLKAWIGELAMHVKSLDSKHLLTVGSEGFYSSNSKGCCSSNPNSYAGTIGTDFIQDHQLPGIDFATVHAYPDSWLSSQNVDDKLNFFSTWVRCHIQDAETILHMPVLFTEFGLSDKKPGFCEAKRDAFYSIVYDQVFQSFQRQGGAAGALQWQLLHPAMRDWNDGYGLEPTCGSSVCNMISQHSVRLQSQSSATSGNMLGMEHQGSKTGSSGRHSISNLLKKGMNHVFK